MPERILLAACENGRPWRPPVRIFIGSESAQARAERVLLWSIERARDPSRIYEITLLRDLPGFRRRGWTTGFSHYRFAVPHLAGGSGRAIYNDVDQIYRADPAELFDRPLDGHGFLAVSPEDLSVMLLDCARMAALWAPGAAERQSKQALVKRARSQWGALPPAWNAPCETGLEGDEKLVHYTTLHTQPWRPFPERFVYLPHAAADAWHDLEREADAAGFLGGTTGRAPATQPERPPPRTWVLLDDRPGNASQARGLAEALDWPFETKSLHYGPAAALHNRLLGASVAGLDRARSSPLSEPWPELVIAAGRRTAPVACWIRERSGGHARLVALGRKAGDDADRFDLCVTPRHARLLAHPERIELSLPFHRVSAERLDEARAQWSALGKHPGPRLALLVGGTTGQYRIDAETAARLGREARAWARSRGGSLWVTTSRRLSPQATEALCAEVPDAALVHRWKPDDAANPYLGILAWADALAITADSESMLAETCSLGKPVYVVALPERASFRALRAPRDWVWRLAHRSQPGPRGTPRPQRAPERFCGRLIERGLVRPTRDLGQLHTGLYERALARPFAQRDRPWSGPESAPPDETARVVNRVRALFHMAPQSAGS